MLKPLESSLAKFVLVNMRKLLKKSNFYYLDYLQFPLVKVTSMVISN